MVSDKESGVPSIVSDHEPEISKVGNLQLNYKCSFCNERFRKLDNKSRHEFKHTGEVTQLLQSQLNVSYLF